MYKVFIENWEGCFFDEAFETYENAIEYAAELFEECDSEENVLIYYNDKVIWEAGEEQK